MEERLKKCPFCGGDDIELIASAIGGSIICNKCNYRMSQFLYGSPGVVESWQTRHKEQKEIK